MMRKQIPLTIIGGYLGAGKTPLLNYVLRHTPRRLAVIVNDFGSINIDADLIKNQDGDTINLANGCICCSLVDGFTFALNKISQMPSPPEHVIVEASGVADPYKLGQQGRLPAFRLDGVIVMADAEQIRARAVDKYVGDTVIRQLKGADLLLLNKVDLMEDGEVTAVHDWLTQLAPDTRIVETSYGQLPLALLLGLHDEDEQEPLHVHDHEHEYAHQEMYQTWSFVWQEGLGETAVRTFFANLPASILRAKGIVYLHDDPERKYLLQLVGKRWSLAPAESWGDQQPQTKLVFIGLPGSIDEHHFETGLLQSPRSKQSKTTIE